MRLSSKIFLLIFALALLFGIASHQLVGQLLEERLHKGQQEWVGVLVHAIAEGMAIDTINGDLLKAQERLINIVLRDKTISYAYVVDFQGQIFAHSFERGFPKVFATMSHRHQDEKEIRRFETADGPVLDIHYPLIEGMAGHLHVGVSAKGIKGLVADARRELMLIVLAVGGAGLLLALWLGSRISRPISQLAGLIKAYGSGRLSGPVRLERSDREVRELTRNFNIMVREREAAEKELRRHREHLEEMVRTRTGELEVTRDQALEATRAKSEFLASMSHELRTPLNSIIGFTGILKDGLAGPVTDEQAKQLGMVYNSARHLLELINDILDLSKVEAGKIELVSENFALTELLDELVDLMQPQGQEKGLQLRLDNPMPLELHTDRAKLRQVLLNLLSNAVKFTEQGEVVVKVRYHQGGLQVEVSDTGIGIPESHLDKVFDSFRQVDMGDDRQHEGTGLGLTISRKFIHLLGGDIQLQSELGKGSRFTVSLPAKLVRDMAGKVPEPSRPAQMGPRLMDSLGQGRLVMVVDDQVEAQQLLRSYLESGGYRVLVCGDGRDAVALARKERPFAITLDLIMPIQDGWQTLAQLKQDPETCAIPVVIISTLDERNLGLSLGAVDYLEKPVEKDALFASIQALAYEDNDILLVEDRKQDAQMIISMLEPEGYVVRHAGDGVLALNLLEVHRPGLILLDLMMPGMSGYEVIRHVRNNPATRDIPIIVISDKSLSGAEQHYLHDNVQDLLVKGDFSRQQMLEEVGHFLRAINHNSEQGDQS